MREYNVDFHIHSKYARAVSEEMEIPVIAEQAELKGLDLVGCGDSLNPKWLTHIKENLREEEDGIYKAKQSKTRFLITTEVEDVNRVHHLIILPSVSASEQLYEKFRKLSDDIDLDGRPHLKINAEEIVDYVKDVGALIGPAHAFTPWTAVYKEFNSLKECYKDNIKHIKFLELGLSADTYMADRIEELQDLTFMSNSDTHSPWPQRLGREFNRVKVDKLSFQEIRDAIERRNNRCFTLNAGLNPLEGKYHLTACTKCFLKYTKEDAKRLKMRCPECGGIIKKGVAERIDELATWDTPHHPPHRPKYVHIIPLAEVISLALGIKTMTSKKITEIWDSFIQKFGTEINVLIDADTEDLKKHNMEVGRIIEKFRAGRIKYVGGGGGQYGHPTLTDEEDKYYGRGQKTLMDSYF